VILCNNFIQYNRGRGDLAINELAFELARRRRGGQRRRPRRWGLIRVAAPDAAGEFAQRAAQEALASGLATTCDSMESEDRTGS